MRTRAVVPSLVLVGPLVGLLAGLLVACGEEPAAAPPAEPATVVESELETEPETEPDPGQTPRPDSPLVAAGADGPQEAYAAWLTALEEQDAATACTIQAPELTIELRYRAILEKRASLGDPCVDFEALLWEDPNREYDPIAVEATQVTDEKATLAVDFPGTDVTVRMIVNRAAWRVQDETPRADPDAARASAGPDQWLDAWCDLETGMGRAEIIDRMGEPSGVYTIANGGEPQLWWAQRQYDFRAYLDGDAAGARALDLVGDYDALSAADRERLTCPELR